MIGDNTLLKYGTGIFIDVGEIEFEKRVFEGDCIEVLCHPDFRTTYTQSQDKFSLTIPKNYKSAEPITLAIQTKKKNAFATIEFIVEEGAEVTLVERMDVMEYLGLHVDLHLKKGASVRYIAMQHISRTAYAFVDRTARVEDSASLHWHDIMFGGKIVKSDIVTMLAGEHAESTLNGLFFGTENQVFDMHHVMHHVSGQTKSAMIAKGVLGGSAKAVYRGLVHIEKDARGCDGQEREDTLLLSPDAQVNAIPELEIGNNDVKCTHAVTTTRVDKEKLFYMQSRGVGEDDARRLCVKAHLAPILEYLGDERLVREIQEIVDTKL